MINFMKQLIIYYYIVELNYKKNKLRIQMKLKKGKNKKLRRTLYILHYIYIITLFFFDVRDDYPLVFVD